MADKRRFVGPNGAIFVPNVDEQTIKQMVDAGEWTPVVPKPAAKKAAAKPPTKK